ncbi:hypothetical protein [Haliangium sp.]|uniref:hypothetical protein n=1 Tax=Haliangium sp. TaxID=2663208 RepID=UPI003D116F52
MTMRQTLEILDHVSEIATLAGFNGCIDQERMQFVMGFEMQDQRSQAVFVRNSSPHEKMRCISILSPCLRLKKGLWRGMSKDMAVDLLRRNEAIRFARYGLWEAKKESLVVASVDYLLESLDPEDFHHAVFHVAIAADQYEREHGLDEF